MQSKEFEFSEGGQPVVCVLGHLAQITLVLSGPLQKNFNRCGTCYIPMAKFSNRCGTLYISQWEALLEVWHNGRICKVVVVLEGLGLLSET